MSEFLIFFGTLVFGSHISVEALVVKDVYFEIFSHVRKYISNIYLISIDICYFSYYLFMLIDQQIMILKNVCELNKNYYYYMKIKWIRLCSLSNFWLHINLSTSLQAFVLYKKMYSIYAKILPKKNISNCYPFQK